MTTIGGYGIKARNYFSSGRFWTPRLERRESFVYTEDDRTLQLGAFATGSSWHRRNDRAGAVFVANGIVADHQQYLGLGGLGFLLGDDGLTYGPEKIFEGFYTAHLWRGFFASFDLQHINNPGYN